MRVAIEVQGEMRLYQVGGRTGQMVQWLVSHVERVEEPEKVQVTFDCAGGSVSVEVKEREKVVGGHHQ